MKDTADTGRFEVTQASGRELHIRAIGVMTRASLITETQALSVRMESMETPVVLMLDISQATPGGPTAPPTFIGFLRREKQRITRVAIVGVTPKGPRAFLIGMVKRMAPVPVQAFVDADAAQDWLHSKDLASGD